jgi:hypothetical protein
MISALASSYRSLIPGGGSLGGMQIKILIPVLIPCLSLIRLLDPTQKQQKQFRGLMPQINSTAARP